MLEETSRCSAESFICDYYSSMYLNSGMNLKNRTEYAAFAEYMEEKLDYLQYVTSEVENFKVSTEIKNKEETENGTLFTIWTEVSFNYIGSEHPSGFGRTAEILVGSGNKIVDMWVNDGIEDNFRKEGIEPLNVIWSESNTAKERISEISLCKQNFTQYQQEQAEAAKTYNEAVSLSNSASALAVSSLTTSQRNKMVTYALNNVSKSNPSSGNSSLVSSYYDFSGFGGDNGDCTNFVSHCLLAGGALDNKINDANNKGLVYDTKYWYYIDENRRSTSWSGVEPFYSFITNNTGNGPKGTPKVFSGKYAPNHGYEAIKGDIVQINYDGVGTFNHTMIITDVIFENNYWNVYLTGRSGYQAGSDWYDKNIIFDEVRFGEHMNDRTYRSIHLTSLT